MATNAIDRVFERVGRAVLRKDDAGPTDAELVQVYIARRDAAAFAALVRRHGPMVLGVCRRILRHEADAEDAFQATFLVLVRKAGSLRSPGQIGNWLYGVAQNAALKAKAMNRKRSAREKEAGASPVRASAEETWGEVLPVLDAELARLPDTYRVPIVLCELEGQTIKEAARHLGWPQGTVATRLSRGRALLARRLARPGLTVSAAALPAVLAHAATAGVPVALVLSTVQAANALAGGPATAEEIPVPVAAISEGVVKTMLLKKLKCLAAVLLAAALLGSGAALVADRTQGAEQKDTKKDAKLPAKEEKPKSDKELLQGTWVAVSGEREGEQIPEDKLWNLVFDGDCVRWQSRDGTYTIDPEKKPKEIDLTIGSLVLTGIYELKGNTLKTLWRENDRTGLPAEFDSKKGILMVFEKKK